LLMDPYLSDSLTKKYAATDKPHVRMTERVIAPEKLDFLDVVTSSHNHTDHLDADTLRPLRAANPKLRMVIPEVNRAFVADRLGSDIDWPIGLSDGQQTKVAGFEISAVPAAHETAEPQFLGYVIDANGLRIYHSGDTVHYDGMAERLREFNVHLALLPINGAKPERRVAGNLNGTEAARLAHECGARCVVPCHYEMFEFNTASTDEFVAEAQRLQQPYRVLRAGERMDLRA
jgi:L-ascorbate metabolism protein UlaG (beta-lactamase superfamily)